MLIGALKGWSGLQIIRSLIVLVVMFLLVSENVFANWKQFSSDYYSAMAQLPVYRANMQPGGTWAGSMSAISPYVRMNVSLTGACSGDCSGGGYGITFQWLHSSNNWLTLYVGEYYGNWADGSGGSNGNATRNYMGVYVPNASISSYADGCNTVATQTIYESNSNVITGFDSSNISGMNTGLFNGLMVGTKELSGGVGYQYIFADWCTGELYWTCEGVCDGAGDPIVTWDDFNNPSTPSPSPTLPASTPIPSPVASPVLSPVASPVVTSTPVQSVSPVPSGNPTSTPYHYPDPVYNSTVVPVPTSDGEMLETNIDDIEYDSSVPDVGQELTEDDTWLDNIFDMFSSHPVIDVIRNSKITTSGELCSLSVNLYGKTIEISFCELTDYVEMFGYFVMVCASIYAYFIIFKVS